MLPHILGNLNWQIFSFLKYGCIFTAEARAHRKIAAAVAGRNAQPAVYARQSDRRDLDNGAAVPHSADVASVQRSRHLEFAPQLHSSMQGLRRGRQSTVLLLQNLVIRGLCGTQLELPTEEPVNR